MRKNALTIGIIAATTGLLAACGGDGNGAADRAEVRVVHASSNAPDVNVALDGEVAVPELAFATATDFLSVDPATFAVTVDAITPGGDVEVINADVALDADQETTIVALGNVGGDGDLALGPLVVTAPDADPAGDEVRVQVVHASAAAQPAGDLDVFVTAPDAALSEADPIGTFGFREDLGPVTVPASDYRIRVTPTGSTEPVFDSGTVTLAGGSDLVVSAIDNVGPGDSPVRLLVAPEGGDSFQILDDGAGAAIGVGHLSADTPNVDVALDGDFNPPAFEDIPFETVTPFAQVPAGTFDIDVAATGSTDPAVSAQDVELVAGERFTGYAVGLLGGGPDLDLIFSQDDIRSVATEARLRVIHAASQVPGPDQAVDVYLTPDGAVQSEADLGPIDPVLPGFTFTEITDFLAVAPGDYEVRVTPAGTTTVAIGPVDLALDGGDVLTGIAIDDDADVGGSFKLLPVDETTR